MTSSAYAKYAPGNVEGMIPRQLANEGHDVRYRKISSRLWGNSQFRSLSSPPPNGQTCYVFLLTGPHTVAIPGLFRAGAAGLAEELGRSLPPSLHGGDAA